MSEAVSDERGHDGGVATVHLVHGYLGVGKTWFARRTERETGGIRFSPDEWYMRLFVGDESTHHLDEVLWRRLMALIDDLWPAVAAAGVDVVLDFGFWTRAARDRARALAISAGAEAVLYQVVCDEADFPDDATCLDWLWRTRCAPDGENAGCPKCETVRSFRRYQTVQQRQSWTCTACGHHLHPTAGTIFHKSSTSLHLWFYAMYLMTSTRCGISPPSSLSESWALPTRRHGACSI